jgi:hypothetical protein
MVWRHPWYIVFALIAWFAVMNLVLRFVTEWDSTWGELIIGVVGTTMLLVLIYIDPGKRRSE